MIDKEKKFNFGRSVKVKLLNIRDKTNYPYQLLLKRYLQERLLYRLSISDFMESFYLKGGVLLYVHQGLLARPTLDIDFLARNISNDKENIKSVFSKICKLPCEEDGVIFDSESITAVDITEEKEYHGVRISITGHLDTVVEKVSIDVGFGDIMVPDPEKLSYPILIKGIPGFFIEAYSLETVIAEKFQSMISMASYNSRMKDFFDVYLLLTNHHYDEALLQSAIQATFKNRQTFYEKDHILFTDSYFADSRRNRQWKGFIQKNKIGDAPEFSQVGNLIRKILKPYWDRLAMEQK